MSVGSLCQVCETETAERSCDRCGRLVCERHYDRSAGVCAVCTRDGDGGGGGIGPGPGGGPDVVR
jgi:hypothetical protein